MWKSALITLFVLSITLSLPPRDIKANLRVWGHLSVDSVDLTASPYWFLMQDDVDSTIKKIYYSSIISLINSKIDTLYPYEHSFFTYWDTTFGLVGMQFFRAGPWYTTFDGTEFRFQSKYGYVPMLVFNPYLDERVFIIQNDNTGKFIIGHTDTTDANDSAGVSGYTGIIEMQVDTTKVETNTVINGSVGIGTNDLKDNLIVSAGPSGTSPLSFSDFTVEDSSHAAMSLLSPGSKSRYIFFGRPGDSTAGEIEYTGVSLKEMRFSVENNIAMRIDSNSNIGINVTTPEERLHVDGNIKAEDTVYASRFKAVGDTDYTAWCSLYDNTTYRARAEAMIRIRSNVIHIYIPSIIGTLSGSSVYLRSYGAFKDPIAGVGTQPRLPVWGQENSTAGLMFIRPEEDYLELLNANGSNPAAGSGGILYSEFSHMF